VSSRGRKPTVGDPIEPSPTPQGVVQKVRPLQGRGRLIPQARGFHPRLLKVLPCGEVCQARTAFHSVDDCTTYLEGAQRLERGRYDLVVLSQGGQTFQGQPLLERAIELDRRRPVLVLTRAVDMRSYLDVMYLGAHDYVEKPPAAWEIVNTVAHCLGPRIASA